MAVKLIHRLRQQGVDYIVPVYTPITIRYNGESRNISTITVGAIGTGPHYFYGLDSDVQHPEYWEETQEIVYISAPFTGLATEHFALPINGIDIVPHSDGWVTFRSDSPHAGERFYFKGYNAKLDKVAGDTVYIEEGKQYYVVTKNVSLLNNLTLQFHTSDKDTSIIDEPIGFDDLKMTMKRHDYHGMGAEVSLGDLEFYGAAFNIIKDAYDADIDGEVIYTIEGDGTTIYTGQVDLTTCSFLRGDYQSVKAKVGEVGVMTTFNNRTGVDIDLNIPKTVDGATVDDPTWHDLWIPKKSLLYTDLSKQKADNTITRGGGSQPYPDTGIYIACGGSYNYPYIFLPIGDTSTVEFGTFEQAAPYTTNDMSNVGPQYTSSSDHSSKYGSNTKAKVDIVLNAKLTRKNTGWSPVGENYIRWRLRAQDNAGHVIYGEQKSVYKPDVNYKDAEWDLSCELHGELDAGSAIKYCLQFDIDLGTATSQSFYAHITVYKGSYAKITMYDTLPDDNVTTKSILVHDALNVVTHAISENALSVKSDWFQTPHSHWNAGAIPSGGSGALKALTNGYHIRGLFTDSDNKRNMPVSFKALIEALDALDCIGWGFSTESNVLYLRVERWDWFYKDTTILTLTNVAEVTTEVLTDRIPTGLIIGYKKYATQDQYNSIDSPHGTRTFTSGIKALAKTINKECEFVADNYAIEETRRARKQVSETEETTYDESIFVLEMISISTDGGAPSFAIGNTSIGATNIGRAAEFINAKLTPRHMAARWRDYLFSTNNSTPFRFTSGEINYKAGFSVIPAWDTDGVTTTLSLKSMATAAPQKENDDISYSHAKFKAEKITFTCPLSIAQYKTVKANPYGLVSVNGTKGWIIDFKYSFHDGTADFTLLAKYVTQ